MTHGAPPVEPGTRAMRIFHISHAGAVEQTQWPAQAPADGFWWVACTQSEFDSHLAEVQSMLQAVCGTQLVDLHISDLRNQQLASRYDYTAQYDLLVFRRLASGHGHAVPAPRRGGPPVLRRIDTTPVGFALFDDLLLTVHPPDCSVRDA